MKFFDWEAAEKGQVFQLHLDGRSDLVMALVTQSEGGALTLITADGKTLRDDEYGNSHILSATRLLLSDGSPF